MMGSIKTLMICLLLMCFLPTATLSGLQEYGYQNRINHGEDYDPLVDLSVTLNIEAIRALDLIDQGSSPDFYLQISINNKTFTSPIWSDRENVYPRWSVNSDVPDTSEYVDIAIELWDYNEEGDIQCDINGKLEDSQTYSPVQLRYSIKKGYWRGDDYRGDLSGYGRLNGCDDGTIYQEDRDCEVWFSITHNDYDDDGLPYWSEIHEYGTDPRVSNRGDDNDMDGIPIEWEHHWNFNPLQYEDHKHLDADNDSLTNWEEYQTRLYGSDPFRKDLFLELDYMNPENPDTSIVSDTAIELLKNPFHRRNIKFYVENGESLPFDEFTDQEELLEIYQHFFLNNTGTNWRRSVFHYGIFVHDCTPTGYSFAGDGPVFWGYVPGTNGFIVSNTQMEKYDRFRPDISLEHFHASVIMHEIGHHFGIRFGNPYGCDNHLGKYPWQISYWIFGNYKSTMNYRYTYKILDYSDGSHGKRDFDDWSNINLSYFEHPTNLSCVNELKLKEFLYQ